MTRVFLLLLLLLLSWSVIESQRQLSLPRVSWQHPIHQNPKCLFTDPLAIVVAFSWTFRLEGGDLNARVSTEPVFFFYIIFIIAWHLHWIARAANSAASSVDTGRRPWRMSFLICRKNWYLRRKTQKKREKWVYKQNKCLGAKAAIKIYNNY